MITVHHLRYSRSSRILWLLEELGEPYDMIVYDRDPKTMRAPPELKAAHPLGKAPVMQDGAVTIAESGAIVEYLVVTYGRGRLGYAPGDAHWPAYVEWLHYAEGSAILGVMLGLLGGADGLPQRAEAYARESRELTFQLIESTLAANPYLVGDDLTGADINLFYVVDFAKAFGMLGDRPATLDWYRRLSERPAYRRAIEKGGPMALPRG